MDQLGLQAIAYYEFLQGHSARVAATNMCSAFKINIVHYSAVSLWYRYFHSGHIYFGVEPRYGRKWCIDDAMQNCDIGVIKL